MRRKSQSAQVRQLHMLDLHEIGTVASHRRPNRVDERGVAVVAKALGKVARCAVAWIFRALHEVNGVEAIEVGKASRVVDDCLVAHQHYVEIAPQLAQQPVDAARAPVPRRKDAKRRHEQDTWTRPWCQARVCARTFQCRTELVGIR